MAKKRDAIPPETPATSGRLDGRFIAVRPEDVARAMASDGAGAVASAAERVCQALTSVIEMETGALRRELDRRYAPYNPDLDTIRVPALGGAAADEGDLQCVREALAYAFGKANFLRLRDVDVEEAMRAASSSGLRVRLDPDGVESMDLFVRGRATIERTRRHWRAPIRGRTEALEVFKRLGVIVRLKGDRHLQLRMYRDIPVMDVEALLPHAEVAMGWWDRAKIAVGGAGALGGIGSKVVSGGLLLSPSTLAVPAAVALGGLSVKSFLGYRRARHTRVSQRTHHLYNLSIASNGAVLHALLGLVAFQEINEGLLLYCACARDEGIEDEAAAKAWVEGWLREAFGIETNFEVADAMETLDRLELWEDRGRLRAVAPEAACDGLVGRLAARAGSGYHVSLAGIAPSC